MRKLRWNILRWPSYLPFDVKNIFTALKMLRRVNTRLRENIFIAALKTLREKVTVKYFAKHVT